jgi:hypothetical protein
LCTAAAVGGLAGLVGLYAAFAGKALLTRWMTAVGLSCYSAAFLALMIAFASESLYPRIPQQFGGGRSESVQLLFASSARRAAVRLGVPLIGHTNLSVSLKVVFTSSDYTLIRLERGSVIQLDKDLVQAAIRAR